MRVGLLWALALGALATQSLARGEVVDAGEPFGPLPLVDEVSCGDPNDPHPFREGPEGASRIEAILDRECRVLPIEGESKYFAYRIGQGKSLKPGGAYVLLVEYPEDQPRSMFITNGGAETTLGFATGSTVGDVLHGRYTNSNPESLEYPLSGKCEAWKTLFYLHDRFPDIEQPRGEGPRPLLPADGFWVIVAQSKGTNDPLSAGAAVSRIRLFGVPEPGQYDVELNLPPEPLPRRHVFWREEMADGVVQSRDETQKGVLNDIDWFEYKARLMRFWGFNTYCKDLLEFGHNQGWDSEIYGGSNWVNQSRTPDRWKNMLAMVSKYGFDVLPYYEYAGSVGQRSIGVQKRAKTLRGGEDYTHITWSEKANAEITDPECLDDAKKVLEATIVRHKDTVRFLGAWFRMRPSHIPMGFGDATLFRFAVEGNGGVAATREQLKADPALLGKYYDWWFGKRREFLIALRDYLREQANPEAIILFTADVAEGGRSLPGNRIVTDDPDTWSKIAGQPGHEKLQVASYQEVVDSGQYLTALLSPPMTWGEWEWQHSCPQPDPQRYKETEGVMMTYTFNRAYTVSDPQAFEAFRTPTGLAVVRHYFLNEHEIDDKTGYFVADVERAGPYCMLGEARAMAYGDPRTIGYLASNCFNRGFPQYVRRFYRAFLALPALPSEIVEGAASDPEVVVRSIPTEDHGTYLAIVNVALTAKQEATITIPAGRATDGATGEALPTDGGKLRLSLDACELRAVHVQ